MVVNAYDVTAVENAHDFRFTSFVKPTRQPLVD